MLLRSLLLVCASLAGTAICVGVDTTSGTTSQAVCATVGNETELRAAVSSLRPGAGGTITLKPGTYVLTETLVLRNLHRVVLAGSGWNTELKCAHNGDAVRLENSHFCVVKDLLLSGDAKSTSGSGIVLSNCSSSVVSFCRIDGFPVSGVRFEGIRETPMSSNTVRDCHFIGNRDAQLFSQHNNDFYVIGNQFGTHGAHPRVGTVLDCSSAGTYSMNYHWGNGVALQLGPAAHFNRIENNRFEESDRSGIVMVAGPNDESNMLNIVTGNTIHTNSKEKMGGFSAVEAHNATDVVFSNNQIFSWDCSTVRHKSGLLVGSGCSSWIITGNTFRHHTEKAIVLENSATHVVKDNIGGDE
jgi:hypothetical protein